MAVAAKTWLGGKPIDGSEIARGKNVDPFKLENRIVAEGALMALSSIPG